MNNKLINVEKLREISNNLPKGSVKEIAKQLGLNHTYVGRVLKGQHHNAQIIEMALELYNKEKALADRVNNI